MDTIVTIILPDEINGLKYYVVSIRQRDDHGDDNEIIIEAKDIDSAKKLAKEIESTILKFSTDCIFIED